MGQTLKKVDHSTLRVNQGVIIVLLLLGFILNAPALAAVVAFFMLGGTAIGRPGFFFVYTLLLRPLGIARPDVLQDNPEPHRFAQGFGGVVAAGSAVLLFTGAALAGWLLTWIVMVLAAANLFLGFCAGCAVYYWLNRLRVPGFARTPPAGTFPGMRPKGRL